MKKLLTLVSAICLLLQISVLTATALTKDEEHGIIGYLWNSAGEVNANKSGSEPLNQTQTDWAEIDGIFAMKLTYAGGTPYDPYISFAKESLGEYRYCAIKYYFDSPDERKSGGRFWISGTITDGGWTRCSFDYTANEWTKLVISFKASDGEIEKNTNEWSNSPDNQITWFRLNTNVKEGEALYLKYLCFFKTREEAESFEGLANLNDYKELVKLANNLNKNKYYDFSDLEAALEFDINSCFYLSDQPAVDAAREALQKAIDGLKLKSDVHGEPVPPSVQQIPAEIIDMDNNTSDTEDTTGQTSGSVDTRDDNTVTTADTDVITPDLTTDDAIASDIILTDVTSTVATETNESKSGCSSSACASLSMIICVSVTGLLLTGRKNKHE